MRTIYTLLILSSSALAAAPAENVIVVMVDGVRWQDAFTGADEGLLNKERGGVTNVAEIKKRFWREAAVERREALLPFVWGTMAKDGAVYGSRMANTPGSVTNKLNFSYPGYSEILCGFVDPKIVSNGKNYNTNETVLEWLHKKPAFAGKVAAFGSWDVFPFIINDKRSGIPVNGGSMPLTGVPETDEVKLLNQLIVSNALEGEDTRSDALTFRTAMLYLKAKKPRVMFLSFDETDTQAHNGRYDRVLASAHKNDGFIKELWETIQAMPEYKGKTTLMVTTDHGRGEAPVEWKSHGAKIAGAESFWAAFVGPGVVAKGEVKDGGAIEQTQIAATVAALLGEDYCKDVTKAGKAIEVGAAK